MAGLILLPIAAGDVAGALCELLCSLYVSSRGALYVGTDQELQRISHVETGKRLWPGAPENRRPMAMTLNR